MPVPLHPVPTPAALDILARTLWGEARGECETGRRAVAWVVRNRAQRAPAYGWPAAVDAVCLQPWQFSCWNANDPNRALLQRLSEEDPLYLACLETARLVTEGGVDDPTHGADHYLNPAAVRRLPRWAKGRSPVAVVGAHHFHRLVE